MRHAGSIGVEEAVRKATRDLQRAGVGSPRVDAEHLLALVLGAERSEVVRRRLLGCELTAEESSAYADLVEQRGQRVPLQHLTGVVDFAGLRLRVGPGVFVPRPETELLVQRARQVLSDLADPVVVDLCTGSGAIALAVHHHVPGAEVHAVDLSDSALAWARQNVATTGLDVQLRREAAATSCSELLGQVDLVTCNPPYIPPGAVPVDPEVADHDPPMALYGGGSDGLEIPLASARRAAELLRPGGVLLLEHGEAQGAALTAAVERSGSWAYVIDHADMSARPRLLEATRS
ncbi:MAG TPA: peptide chain release factor N(5)-glutamine methyltransferase [Ornithinimicrobium sp.]|uniref:peptide chain release factor N(5)-glutamine methyltransferase n=1 Tax=Ornithinimicrobium sp. TaxID=1977084 RepID=UPI002B4619CE|nr:peptide chain release factor N(5)-glutamine methyltransferase [Ornithinimicrobium sp.]HKJ12829.1 peptide chain release factor N(5)-glutamine methyltransferase [Ornithinimicrobium sp.]